MAEDEAEDEPTMEEILSSIRRIISEDGDAVENEEVSPESNESQFETEAVPMAPAEPELETEPEAEVASDEDVLDLTEAVGEDSDMPRVTESSVAAKRVDEDLVSDPTADATTEAFSNLAGAVNDVKGVALGSTHHTLEELVRELLRPMLKVWLDANLEPIVARAVEREITKLAGRAEPQRKASNTKRTVKRKK